MGYFSSLCIVQPCPVSLQSLNKQLPPLLPTAAHPLFSNHNRYSFIFQPPFFTIPHDLLLIALKKQTITTLHATIIPLSSCNNCSSPVSQPPFRHSSIILPCLRPVSPQLNPNSHPLACHSFAILPLPQPAAIRHPPTKPSSVSIITIYSNQKRCSL